MQFGERMNDNETTAQVAQTTQPALPAKSFPKDVAAGLKHVAKVIWQVPEARGFIATLLVRFGVPASIAAIGMAVGEKLAQ
jgi:hypothetical protein